MEALLALQRTVLDGGSVNLEPILATEPTAELVVLWREGFLRKTLDPDLALIQSIRAARNQKYLLLIALALRAGGNPNIYVAAPRYGNMHLLAYNYVTHRNLPDPELVELITSLLLLCGARPAMLALDPLGGRIEGSIDPTRMAGADVVTWLQDQGYETMLSTVEEDISTALRPEILIYLQILLNRDIGPVTLTQMTDIIPSFAHLLYPKFTVPLTEWPFTGLDYGLVELAVKALNPGALAYLLDQGATTSYVLMNTVLRQYRRHTQYGLTLVAAADATMLLELIRRGALLDKEQFALLSMTGGEIVAKVQEEYDLPYWRKACKNPKSPVSGRLRRLAFNLNLDPTLQKTSVCEALRELSGADPAQITAAATARQQQRVSSELSLISEYVNSQPPLFTCRNRSLLEKDPFAYGDVELAVYRDSQEVVWCYTSDMFTNLLASGKNPYNLQPLPETFKTQLDLQLATLKRLNIDYMDPQPIDQALAELNRKDEISNVGTERIVKSILTQAEINGVAPETLQSQSPENLEAALAGVGLYVPLKDLTSTHTLATFAQAAQSYLKRHPDQAARLFAPFRSY